MNQAPQEVATAATQEEIDNFQAIHHTPELKPDPRICGR